MIPIKTYIHYRTQINLFHISHHRYSPAQMEVGACPDKSLKGSKLHSLASTALYCRSAEPEGASMHHCSGQGPCTWGNRQQRSPMPTQPASACYQLIPPPKHSYTNSAPCCFRTKQQSQLLRHAQIKTCIRTSPKITLPNTPTLKYHTRLLSSPCIS